MPSGIQIVTDSSAQRLDVLRDRFEVDVVPLTVVVDEHQYREGVDLDESWFLEQLRDGATISTAAPSPGEFLRAYQDAAERGSGRVLSLHLDEAMSGTANSARVAAQMSPIPVEVVDTRAMGFGLHRCVRAAASVLMSRGDMDDAVEAAKAERAKSCNVFVVGQTELLARGGRMSGGPTFSETSVWAGHGEPPQYLEVGKVGDVESLAKAVGSFIGEHRALDAPLIGVGDIMAGAAADAVSEVLQATTDVDVLRFSMTPSIAAHLGLGTVFTTFTIDRSTLTS